METLFWGIPVREWIAWTFYSIIITAIIFPVIYTIVKDHYQKKERNAKKKL